MQPLAQQQLKRRGGHTSVVVVAGERARDRERERERESGEGNEWQMWTHRDFFLSYFDPPVTILQKDP
jgi:hypothetical protein